MSRAGMQPSNTLEGVTDMCQNGPLGIGIAWAGGNGTRLAALPDPCPSKGSSASPPRIPWGCTRKEAMWSTPDRPVAAAGTGAIHHPHLWSQETMFCLSNCSVLQAPCHHVNYLACALLLCNWVRGRDVTKASVSVFSCDGDASGCGSNVRLKSAAKHVLYVSWEQETVLIGVDNWSWVEAVLAQHLWYRDLSLVNFSTWVAWGGNGFWPKKQRSHLLCCPWCGHDPAG